jgi:hypothetical protein
LEEFREQVGTVAVAFAAHLAIPVVVTPTLVNLIRTRFFVDPPEQLPFSIEAELLLTPMFRSIGADLYQMETDFRELLISDLDVRYGAERARQVGELLYHYSIQATPWTQFPLLDAAQQLTAYSLIDPPGADRALKDSEQAGARSAADPRWQVAMRAHLDLMTQSMPSSFFEQAVRAARDGDMDLFESRISAGLDLLPIRAMPVESVQALIGIVRQLGNIREGHQSFVFIMMEPAIDELVRQNRQRQDDIERGFRAIVHSMSDDSAIDSFSRLLTELGATTSNARRPANWAVERVGASLVWSTFGIDGAGVRVCVLGTGIQSDNPALVGRVSQWKVFAGPGSAAITTSSVDPHGNGTQVAGLVAGDQAAGWATGVAPGAQLLNAAVLDEQGSGSDATVLAGLEWALGERVDVIVCPLGSRRVPASDSPYDRVLDVLEDYGIVLVTPAGNSGPGNIDSPGSKRLAIAVGATDRSDVVASFSGGGKIGRGKNSFVKPDLVAPGVGVPVLNPDGSMVEVDGTSFGCALVGGVVALLLSATSIRQKLSGADRNNMVRQCLYRSASGLGKTQQDERYGWGLVDAYAAIREAWALGFKP